MEDFYHFPIRSGFRITLFFSNKMRFFRNFPFWKFDENFWQILLEKIRVTQNRSNTVFFSHFFFSNWFLLDFITFWLICIEWVFVIYCFFFNLPSFTEYWSLGKFTMFLVTSNLKEIKILCFFVVQICILDIIEVQKSQAINDF